MTITSTMSPKYREFQNYNHGKSHLNETIHSDVIDYTYVKMSKDIYFCL